MITELKINEEIKNEILRLTEFAEFLKQLREFSVSDEKYLDKIKEDLQKGLPSTRTRYWDMSLQIIDRKIQYRETERQGAWSRKWTAYFENNCLEVRSATYSTEDEFPDGECDFWLFINYSSGEVYRIGTNIEEFLKDTREYKKYITEYLNEIEMDIDY